MSVFCVECAHVIDLVSLSLETSVKHNVNLFALYFRATALKTCC